MDIVDGIRAWGQQKAADVGHSVASVAHTVQSAEHQVQRTVTAAGKLYQAGAHKLHSVADAVAKHAPDLNPLHALGAPSRLLGRGLKWLGQSADDSAAYYDQNRGGHNAVQRSTMGAASGLAGFGGSLLNGLGTLADYGGRLEQGDPETWKATGQTLKSLGEAAVYVDGTVRQATGGIIGAIGDKTGIAPLQKAGQAWGELGKREAGLTSPHTKRVVDGVAEAGVHYESKAAGVIGEGLTWAGKKTGSQALQETGSVLSEGGAEVARQTGNNPLVRQVDGIVADHMQQYKADAPYAVTRDATRATAEIASLFVNPESVFGKAGTATEVAEDTARAGKALSATEAAAAHEALTAPVAGATSKAGPWVTDAANPAVRTRTIPSLDRGPDWVQEGSGVRERAIKATDGKPDWRQTDPGDGSISSRRTYEMNGQPYTENIVGQNRWRVRENMRAEAKQEGTRSFTMASPKGDVTVNVHGARDTVFKNGKPLTRLNPATGVAEPVSLEYEFVKGALNRLPWSSRGFVSDVHLGENLGDILDLHTGQVESGIGGLGGHSISLSRDHVSPRTTFHEFGHAEDFGTPGMLSKDPIWGHGESVDPYAARNALEDFASTYAEVAPNLSYYLKMSPQQMAAETAAAKKIALLKHYGF